MNLIDQYLLIAFVFTIAYMVVVAQAVVLSRILKSRAWVIIAVAFALSGARLVWSLVRLPAAILRAQSQHQLPDGLTAEQWVQVFVAALVVTLLITGFGLLMRDLKKINLTSVVRVSASELNKPIKGEPRP